jgi:hypothetical protein
MTVEENIIEGNEISNLNSGAASGIQRKNKRPICLKTAGTLLHSVLFCSEENTGD